MSRSHVTRAATCAGFGTMSCCLGAASNGTTATWSPFSFAVGLFARSMRSRSDTTVVPRDPGSRPFARSLWSRRHSGEAESDRHRDLATDVVRKGTATVD